MSTGPRALTTGLHELKYDIGNEAVTLIDYHRRHKAGLRKSYDDAKSTANFLINRRINKNQQMRWSRRDADLLLQSGRRYPFNPRPRVGGDTNAIV